MWVFLGKRLLLVLLTLLGLTVVVLPVQQVALPGVIPVKEVRKQQAV
jgi:hypothetical protein